MHNKLLKVAALALVLAFGSMGRMVWASAGNQPGSFSYPVEMAIRKMSLTRTVNEVTESTTQMGFVQGQADEMQRLAGDGWDDACLGDDCDRTRDQDRDRDCTPSPVPTGEGRGGGLTRDQDRDRDGTCDGDNCDPARDQNRDRDGTCDGDDCDPARDQDRDRDGTPSPVPTGEGRGGGHSGGQGGGGHH